MQMKLFRSRNPKVAVPTNSAASEEPRVSIRAEPITPNSDKPPFLTPDGKTRYGAEENYHFACFDAFRNFGDFFNSWRSSTPFRLQELLDTKITYRKGELNLGPNYGHRYDVYYYQSRVGLLQISASRVMMNEGYLVFSEDIQRSESCEVHVDICLDTFGVHATPFKDVQDFLHCIARMLSDPNKPCEYTEPEYRGMTQREYVLHVLQKAMLEALWNNQTLVGHTIDARYPLLFWFSGAPSEWYSQISAQR